MAATTIQGTNGKFEVTVTGNTIDIKYTGDPTKITCKKIVFVQTVKSTIDGTVVKPPSAQKNMKDLQNGKHSDDDQIDDGTYVDHLFCEKDPYYNGDDKPQDGGTQGNTETGTPSTMSDSPSQGDSDLPNADSCVVKDFETCAYCVDTGKFLDCIKWTYKRCKGDANAGTVTVASTTCSTPSQSMQDAKKKFDTNHTGADGKPICPEEKAVVVTEADTPGGSRTIVVQGGTDIQTWDVAVFPDAVLRASVSLDVNQNALRTELFSIQTGIDQLRDLRDAADMQPIVDELTARLASAQLAANGIEFASHTLRTEGIRGQQFAPAPQPLVLPVDAAGIASRATQVKITSVSGQEKPVPTLIFNSFTSPLNVDLFAPYKRPGINYANDGITNSTFTVRASDVQQFAARVLANPALSNPEFSPEEPYYSLTIVDGEGAGFESLVDEWNGDALIDAVLASIDPANVFAYQMAKKWSRMSRPQG